MRGVRPQLVRVETTVVVLLVERLHMTRVRLLVRVRVHLARVRVHWSG